MITISLKRVLDRIETWPETAQDEAAATLEAIEQELVMPYTLTSEDREAIERSAEDVRQDRFASEEDVQKIFDRFHRR